MLKRGPSGPVSAGESGMADADPARGGPAVHAGSLGVLKEELFSLETDRLQGRIGAAEYAEHKAALEVVLRRVLARAEAGNETRTSV